MPDSLNDEDGTVQIAGLNRDDAEGSAGKYIELTISKDDSTVSDAF